MAIMSSHFVSNRPTKNDSFSMFTDYSQENSTSGNPKADSKMVGPVPSQVRDRQPLLINLSPLEHECHRDELQADKQQGFAFDLLLFLLW